MASRTKLNIILVFMATVYSLNCTSPKNVITAMGFKETVLADSILIDNREATVETYTYAYCYLMEKDRMQDTLLLGIKPSFTYYVYYIDLVKTLYANPLWISEEYSGRTPLQDISYEEAKALAKIYGEERNERMHQLFPREMRHKKIIGRLPYLSEWLTFYQHHYDKKEPIFRTYENVPVFSYTYISKDDYIKKQFLGLSKIGLPSATDRAMHMLGSVAEMTEDKYIIGGSFLDSLANCYPEKSLRKYTKAEPLVGFRIALVLVND
jgi:hypothetical protein